MILNNEETWPSAVLDYLEPFKDLFLHWERRPQTWTSEDARQYDSALDKLRSVLDRYTLQNGYHCTRLTDSEISLISSNGLQLPNGALLRSRIDAIEKEGVIQPQIAERLRSENEADEHNRANLIWFCFFPPHLAGQCEIERFFRSWGGESLYSCHEHDPLTGPILRRIGTPCIVEADVPIASLDRYTPLEKHVIWQFLIDRGFETVEELAHEDRARRPVPAGNIRRIIRFPEPDFVALTTCDTWTPTL